MNAITRYLAFIVLFAAAALATGQTDGQSQPVVHQLTPTEEAQFRKMLAAHQRDIDSHELRTKDIDAQQPQEKLAASAPCQRAFESPNHHIIQRTTVESGTVVRSLSDLMKKSDEVVLAGVRSGQTFVFSPSGDTVVDYFDVTVFRSWKGTHEVGDTLTFAVPVGSVDCGMDSGRLVRFSTMVGFYSTALRTFIWKGGFYNGPYILFLLHPQGKETELVQTLFPTGAEGLQGMFPIPLDPTSIEEKHCTGAMPGGMELCDSFLETSTQTTIIVPYVADPLAKKYDGMPIADFLNVVRNLAADQGLDEKRP